MRSLLSQSATLALALALAQTGDARQRVMRAEDLFRVERIGAIRYSPDGKRAAVEIRRPGRWLDPGMPTADIALVDLASGALRFLSRSSPAYIGFFGAAWSPNGSRLLLLSVDTNAVVRPWVWAVGANSPRMLGGWQLRDGTADPPVAMWGDDDHALFMVKEPSQPDEGPLYFRIMRGANGAHAWRRARQARLAAVTVLDSRGPDTASAPSRIVSVDVRSGGVTTLARGALHRPRISADGRTLTFRSERPGLSVARVESFFGPDAQGDAAYDVPNWGNSVHHVDAKTGAEVPSPDTATGRGPVGPAATIRVVNDAARGTSLVLARSGRADTVVWHGNDWIRSIETGRAEAIRYVGEEGTNLIGWVLYPPRHIPGRQIPIVTFVYPGTLYGEATPGAISIFNESFLHPQMLAALGYGVLFPSMPEPEKPLQMRGLDALKAGVLPLLDTLIARGIADSSRIAVMGHSAGGHATLGLVTQATRFRTAIASASYSNLTSLYGAFYGQYRHGDSGSPQRAQVLRMLQLERGYFGAGAPPWEEPERYAANSPIMRAGDVRTPVLLIHGELDYIPVQQAEEFFTALYRQDKRVKLVRYAGEGHTISGRAHVLDLWERIGDWLRETMPSAAVR